VGPRTRPRGPRAVGGGPPLPFTPEELYRGLRSYTEGVAITGVRALLAVGPQLGFNALWHEDVSEALMRVEETLDTLRTPRAN